jgi:hypothetical protein
MHKHLVVAAAAIFALPVAAAAHHGWGWTQEQESRLSGTIQSISFGNPHMHLQLRDSAGATWEVDLSPPIVGRASGFAAEHARAGDRAVITGHRARDAAVRGFKGETITVRGRTFDVYPQREKTLSPD